MTSSMSDVFNVTAAYTPAPPAGGYPPGATITIAISGGDVLTSTSTATVGPIVLTITAADGATTTVTVPSTSAQVVTSTPESVKITAVQDTGPNPLTWTIAANGLSASAVAP